jgi:hypothetical protein
LASVFLFERQNVMILLFALIVVEVSLQWLRCVSFLWPYLGFCVMYSPHAGRKRPAFFVGSNPSRHQVLKENWNSDHPPKWRGRRREKRSIGYFLHKKRKRWSIARREDNNVKKGCFSGWAARAQAVS